MRKHHPLPIFLFLLLFPYLLMYGDLPTYDSDTTEQVSVWDNWNEDDVFLLDDDSKEKFFLRITMAFPLLIFLIPGSVGRLVQLFRRLIYLAAVFYQSSYLVFLPLNKN